MGGLPASFGRPEPQPEPQQVMVAPLMQMPVHLVPDPASLQTLATQVTELVKGAVRRGFEEAYAELQGELEKPAATAAGG
jgi:hypothetical protein